MPLLAASPGVPKNDAQPQLAPTVIHVTTVPESLRFLAGLPAHLGARGFVVQAISSPGPDLDWFAHSQGVAVHAIPMRRRIAPRADLAAFISLVRHFRRTRPTIVHAHTPKAGLLATAAACLSGVPVRIYHIHGLPCSTARGPRRALLRAIERLACLMATRVLCVSHSLGREVVGTGLCPDAKLAVLCNGSINGVDAQVRFNPNALDQRCREATRRRHGIPRDAVVLGFVGRIVRDKGIVELVEAWARLRQEDARLHLLLVGAPEDADPVPEAVMLRLHRDERVHFAGFNWETPPLLSAMDLLVLPSYREGFPVTLLEAAAMALPVVATRIAGCLDAVSDGVTGGLVAARDSLALAGAVRRYTADDRLRLAHGQAGRERVLRDFQPKALQDSVADEYARLLHAVASAEGASASAGPSIHTRIPMRANPPAQCRPSSRSPSSGTWSGS